MTCPDIASVTSIRVSGMSVKDRELVVFAAIAALGGCEAQLKAHADANLKEGCD